MIAIVPLSGLSNRMRSLDSAISLSKATREDLYVIWCLNQELNCRFDDLFVVPDSVKRLYHINTNCLAGKIGLRLIRLLFRVFFNLHLTDANMQEQRERGCDLEGIVRGQKIDIVACKRFHEGASRFADFVPIEPLQRLIDSQFSEYSEMVGVHLRRADGEWPIRYSPTEEFIRLMEREIRVNRDIAFFVASDSAADEKRLQKTFPNRIVTHRKRSYDRNDPIAIQDALIDLYCLSRCRKVIGSFGSSFTDTAWQLNGIEKEIATVLPTPSVAFSGKLKIGDLADDASCFETLRRVRWDKGIFCPECGGDQFSQTYTDDSVPHLRRYYCHNCARSFDDLTGTVFSRHPATVA